MNEDFLHTRRCWCGSRAGYAEQPIFDHGWECLANPLHDPATSQKQVEEKEPATETVQEARANLARQARAEAARFDRQAELAREAAAYHRERALRYERGSEPE